MDKPPRRIGFHKSTVEIPSDIYWALKYYCESSSTTVNKAIIDAIEKAYGKAQPPVAPEPAPKTTATSPAAIPPAPQPFRPWENCVISTTPGVAVVSSAPAPVQSQPAPEVVRPNREQPRQGHSQVPPASKGRYAGAAKILLDSLKELGSQDA